MQRVQKIIAASGYCSRRKAEELIAAGKVTVNGQKIKLGDQATTQDIIMVGKQRITVSEHRYLMLNKPTDYITTREDKYARKHVMHLINTDRPVYPVGRLDRDARGMLLLTSDGDFAQKVLHPRNEVTKTYQAMLEQPLTKEATARLGRGVLVDGRRVRAHIKKIKPKLVELTIHEGRHKIVKRLFKAVGYRVSGLKRVAIGGLRLDVPEGRWRELTEQDKQRVLRKA